MAALYDETVRQSQRSNTSLFTSLYKSLLKCLSDFGAFISGRRQLYTYLVPACIAISLFSQTTTQVMRDARNRNNYSDCHMQRSHPTIMLSAAAMLQYHFQVSPSHSGMAHAFT